MPCLQQAQVRQPEPLPIDRGRQRDQLGRAAADGRGDAGLHPGQYRRRQAVARHHIGHLHRLFASRCGRASSAARPASSTSRPPQPVHTLEEQLVRLAQHGPICAHSSAGLAPVAPQLRPHLAKEGEACGSCHECANRCGRPLLARHKRRQQLAAEAEPWRAVSGADDGKLRRRRHPHLGAASDAPLAFTKRRDDGEFRSEGGAPRDRRAGVAAQALREGLKRMQPGTEATDLPVTTASAPLPTRISVATFNVWTTKGKPGGPWPARIPALQQLVRLCSADLIGVQEAHPDILAVIDEALPAHARIAPENEAESVCWRTEGTIYYRRAALELLAHGCECSGSFPEKPNRRLFWARFRAVRARCYPTVMPRQGTASEVQSGGKRFACRAVADALKALAQPGEPAFCVGDFNESFGFSLLPPRAPSTASRPSACRRRPRTRLGRAARRRRSCPIAPSICARTSMPRQSLRTCSDPRPGCSPPQPSTLPTTSRSSPCTRFSHVLE